MASVLFEDTIAAIATPPGRGAVALVRVSGPAAGDVLRRLAPRLAGDLPEPRLQSLLPLRHPETGAPLDRALVAWFPGPASYTGEDTVEISSHGGTLTPQLILDAAYAAGARPAEAGEFTRRAVFHGKMDLLQAEAVLDLIDGRSPALHRAAIHQIERGLSRRIEELRAALLRLEALVAYDIDFPDEDEPPVPKERVQAAAAELLERMDLLLRTAPQGEMLREGALVVLAGRPNSGKSSLFNALIGSERAIVTEVPGTTRDALEASITIDDYPFRLVDTAGLRETVDRVEEIGIEVARRYLRGADLVLFCVEAGRELAADEAGFLTSEDPLRTLLIRTKADLLSRDGAAGGLRPQGAASVCVSATTGLGMPELRAELLRRSFGTILGDPGEAPLVTRARHARALRAAREEVRLFLDAHASAVPPELAATHLRAAAAPLEDLVGALTPEDLLGQIFTQFCVGK